MSEFVNHKSTYIIKRLLKNHVSPYKARILSAIFFMVIVAGCSAAIVQLVKPAIDRVLLTNDEEMLILVPTAILAIYFLKGVAEYFQSFLIKYVGQQILTDLQIEMYEHLLRADLSFLQKHSSGKLISRFTNDIILMRGAVSHMLVGCAKYFLSVLFLIIIMFKLDLVLSLFVFVAFPLAIYPIQKIGRRMRNVVGKAQEELSNYTSRLDETFKSIKVIKSFSGEKTEANRARNIIAEILEYYRRTARLDALTSPIMEILCGIAVACILWYGAMMVRSGQTTPGSLLAFITAFASAYRPFKSLVSLNVNLQEGLAAANRVFNLLDTKPEIKESKESKDFEFVLPEIKFDNVELKFGERVAVHNINLTIEKAKTYAFVGRSGSGKTTLSNLLVRFYEPTNGNIHIADHDIKEIKIASLRSQIALVTQDTILFDASIAENIAYGKQGASFDEIVVAAKAADAHDFISKLPEGYNTGVGSGGYALSGGQRQRLAIARAFLKDAPILILDEATSALDPNSELAILQSLAKLRRNRTTLFITHRLSAIEDVDQIVVMKNGKISEQGNHADLLKNKKEYFRLFNKELKDNEENV